jgi:hypothetical protein
MRRTFYSKANKGLQLKFYKVKVIQTLYTLIRNFGLQTRKVEATTETEEMKF